MGGVERMEVWSYCKILLQWYLWIESWIVIYARLWTSVVAAERKKDELQRYLESKTDRTWLCLAYGEWGWGSSQRQAVGFWLKKQNGWWFHLLRKGTLEQNQVLREQLSLIRGIPSFRGSWKKCLAHTKGADIIVIMTILNLPLSHVGSYPCTLPLEIDMADGHCILINYGSHTKIPEFLALGWAEGVWVDLRAHLHMLDVTASNTPRWGLGHFITVLPKPQLRLQRKACFSPDCPSQGCCIKSRGLFLICQLPPKMQPDK